VEQYTEAGRVILETNKVDPEVELVVEYPRYKAVP
jgi:hypothetical protein